MIHDLLGVFLKEFELSSALNGEEAIMLLQEKEVGLVITDFNMPIMNGLALCQQIRQQFGRKLPVILCSTMHGNSPDEQMEFASYFDAIIAKPIDQKLLHQEVATLLGKKCQE